MPILPGFSSSVERWLLRQVFNTIGQPPIRVVLPDGVAISSTRAAPQATVLISDYRTLLGLLLDPETGFGDAYAEGRIQVQGNLLALLDAVYRSWPSTPGPTRYSRIASNWMAWWQANSPRGSRKNVHYHYDLSTDFYKLWLDRELVQANAAFANSATPINVRVLNMSWGGLGFSQAFADEINKANANNMLLVAAAGNKNLDNDVNPYYPSSYNAQNIIAVASTDSNDNRTSWSDYGASTVHLAAPGENIYSTMLGGGYMFLNGTSMSAAYVSGAAQLVLSKCSLDTAGLKNDLLNNVDALAAWSGLTTTAGRRRKHK